MEGETASTPVSVSPDYDSPEVRRRYDLLGILDSKAAALLTFNAIGLAVLTLWLSYVPPNLLHLSLDFVFILLLASCAALLTIIFLRWADRGTDLEKLDRIKGRRTIYYHVAWGLSITSVFSVFVVATIHMLGTALVAFDACNDACQSFYSEAVFGNLDTGRNP